MRNVWRGMLVLAMALMMVAFPQEASAKVKVKKVTVQSNYGTSVHVAVGKKIKLKTTVKVSPNKAANKKVTYKSSNKKIATVTSSGYVKGIKTGKCKVTVTAKKNKKKKAKITINVVKKVTSVRIATPKNALYAGNSLTLKATVNPTAGSYKKVTWSTSDKTIATVSSAGKVTGVKAGTVTIKATSVEGSKKVGSVKLTVLATNSVSIASVEVLNDDAVRVVLDKAMKLTADQFTLEGKKYVFGTYTRKFKIAQMRNYDDKTYDLTLDSTYSIDKDSFVRVTISALPGNGTKTMETQAIYVRNTQPLDEKWLGVVGEKWDKTVDLSDYCCGNISYQVTGTIPGIAVKATNNQLTFSGTLTTVTVGTEVTVKATDEMGSTVSKTIRVYVGNESTIVGTAEDTTILVSEEIKDKVFASALGGSGNYTYSAINLPAGIQLDETTGMISGKATSVGEYKVQLTIADKENEKRTCQNTATIRVVDQRKVVGNVLDANGKALAGVTIVCENVSDGTAYQAETDATGAYTIYVGEGSYNIVATKEEKKDGVYNIAVGTGGRQIHFTL